MHLFRSPTAAAAAALLVLACQTRTGADAPTGHEPSTETVASPRLAFDVEEQTSGVGARLQAVSAVDARVVWASGLDGTVLRTLDGGASWELRAGAGGADSKTLQFRDVHAFDEETAYLLAAGEGELSRLYRTGDGGASWELQYLNIEPEGFLDCFGFWDRDRGIAYGDSVAGELFVLTTADGANWKRVAPASLPPAGEGEGGFAASGTCVAVGSPGRAWIATGAGGNARVLRTEDFGASWSVAESPTVRGPSAGLMSVVFADDRRGVALGGDLEQAEELTANVAITSDGGATWTPGGKLPFPGAAYGAAWRAGALIAHGPGGIAASTDSGRSWHPISEADTWAVAFGDDETFWAVGPEGRILRFRKR